MLPAHGGRRQTLVTRRPLPPPPTRTQLPAAKSSAEERRGRGPAGAGARRLAWARVKDRPSITSSSVSSGGGGGWGGPTARHPEMLETPPFRPLIKERGRASAAALHRRVLWNRGAVHDRVKGILRPTNAWKSILRRGNTLPREDSQ